MGHKSKRGVSGARRDRGRGEGSHKGAVRDRRDRRDRRGPRVQRDQRDQQSKQERASASNKWTKRAKETQPLLPFGDRGPCPLLSRCKACPLLPLSPSAQRAHKLEALRGRVASSPALSGAEVTLDDTPSPSEGYRRTAKPAVRGVSLDDQLAHLSDDLSDSSDQSREALAIGLYSRGSHDLIDLQTCWVQSPRINELLRALREVAPSLGVVGYRTGDELRPLRDTDESLKRSVLRYVVAREGVIDEPLVGQSLVGQSLVGQSLVGQSLVGQSLVGQSPVGQPVTDEPDTPQGSHSAQERSRPPSRPALYLTLVVTEYHRSQLDALAQALTARCPDLVGLGVHLNRSPGNAIFDFSAPTKHLWGHRALAVEVHDPNISSDPLMLRVSAESFTQVNPAVAGRAYQRLVSALDPSPGDLAIDLYCGVGAIALSLARAARAKGGALSSAWGLEETPSSIGDARENAKRLGYDEVRFCQGRAEDELPKLTAQLTAESRSHNRAGDEAYDDAQDGAQDGAQDEAQAPTRVIVALNPSRRGCQPSVLKLIAQLKPQRIAYMSCDAKTLIRDLERLSEYGYHTRSLTLFDMFPGSDHYETVAVIEPHTPREPAERA